MFLFVLYRFLFEPEKYPGNGIEFILVNAFGNGSRKDMPICVFAFEPNPEQIKHQMAIQDAYRKMGWRYTFFNVAVGSENSTLTFWTNDQNVSRFSFWAFSSFKLAQPRSGPRRPEYAFNCPVIDVAAWIQQHILQRRLPVYQSALPPRVVIKMDIEGHELPILTRFVLTGVACEVFEVFLEVHKLLHPVQLKSNITLETESDILKYFAQLRKVVQAGGCVNFRVHDSEMYREDGKPLPVPQGGRA